MSIGSNSAWGAKAVKEQPAKYPASMMFAASPLSLILLLIASAGSLDAFLVDISRTFRSTPRTHQGESTTMPTPTMSFAASTKYSPLPPGLSPFEKSLAKGIDVQANFRGIAAKAIEQAVRDGQMLLEVEFPSLVGGDKTKTQFDDFDNIQELDANRDWCTQLAPMLNAGGRTNWLVFPDDKECELARLAWGGQRYQRSAKFTSLRAACSSVAREKEVTKAWGSRFAEAINKLQGGDGILADSSTLDVLDEISAPRLHLVCQPGNGGPVEDWINVEKLHRADPSQVMCVVNGSLDKVRDGYYPALFFPALAATTPFYRSFEPVFYLKPVSEKGVYGWLYRVYPEPWQVILQTAKSTERGGKVILTVEQAPALSSTSKPSYEQTVKALLEKAAQ
jgi:Domain of unknown function (DUF1995)